MSIITRGVTSVKERWVIPDSSSIIGAGNTGLTYNSINLVIKVIRAGSAAPTSYAQSAGNIEDITTLGTYQAPSTSSKCRFKHVANGVCEVHFHNDAGHFAVGDGSEKVQLWAEEETTTALNIGPNWKEIQLVAFDLQTATQSVDVDTIKTQAITCANPVTVLANLGFAGAPGASNGAFFLGTNTGAAVWNAPIDIDCLTVTARGTGRTVYVSSETGTAFTVNSLSRAVEFIGLTTAFRANFVDIGSSLTTLLNRLGAWTGTGINTVLGAFRAAVAKAGALTPTDLSSGTTFDNTTDSLEGRADLTSSEILAGTVESGAVSVTVKQALQLVAALGGKVIYVDNGDGTVTLSFRDPNDAKNRIVIVASKTDGSRSSSTFDFS